MDPMKSRFGEAFAAWKIARDLKLLHVSLFLTALVTFAFNFHIEMREMQRILLSERQSPQSMPIPPWRHRGCPIKLWCFDGFILFLLWRYASLILLKSTYSLTLPVLGTIYSYGCRIEPHKSLYAPMGLAEFVEE